MKDLPGTGCHLVWGGEAGLEHQKHRERTDRTGCIDSAGAGLVLWRRCIQQAARAGTSH
jgi:hypothetical protein